MKIAWKWYKNGMKMTKITWNWNKDKSIARKGHKNGKKMVKNWHANDLGGWGFEEEDRGAD